MRIGGLLIDSGCVGLIAGFVLPLVARIISFYLFLLDEMYLPSIERFSLVLNAFFCIIVLMGVIIDGAEQIVQAIRGKEPDNSRLKYMSVMALSGTYLLLLVILEHREFHLTILIGKSIMFFICGALGWAIRYSLNLIAVQIWKR